MKKAVRILAPLAFLIMLIMAKVTADKWSGIKKKYRVPQHPLIQGM